MSNNQLICPNCNGVLNPNEVRQGFLVCPYCRSMNVRALEQAQPTTHSSFAQQTPQNPTPPPQQPIPQVINSYQQSYAPQSNRSGGSKTWLWVLISIAAVVFICIACCVGFIIIDEITYNNENRWNNDWNDWGYTDNYLLQRPPSNSPLIGTWYRNGLPHYVFNSDGTGTRAGLPIRWYQDWDIMSYCTTPNSCRWGACPLPRSWYFDVFDGTLTLTELGNVFNMYIFTRSIESDDRQFQVPPANSPVIGSWDWALNGALFYVFYADGTGQMFNILTNQFVPVRWYQDDDIIHICTSPNVCIFGNCPAPMSWYFELNDDTLILTSLLTWEEHVYVRENPLFQPLQLPSPDSQLIGVWGYLDPELVLNADGTGNIYDGSYRGSDFRWYQDGNLFHICDTPDVCLPGRCWTPASFHFYIDNDRLTIINTIDENIRATSYRIE